MSTEGLILLCMIGAMEGRDVETAEILGELPHTDYNKGDMNIKMEGAMTTLLEKIDMAYYKDFIYLDIRGGKCMYAEAKKNIYGTLEAYIFF